ncbi:MAG TPA: FlgD immunoglobulin-like domain containing protein, partial [Gemmatimonadales bacterium]|nr:FlgD immunoglobulin-like domain containing protein [Gemmatimonadales bacterium]
ADEGHDYFCAVNGAQGIEFREMVWGTPPHFHFAEPVSVQYSRPAWNLRLADARPGWQRLAIRLDAPRSAEIHLAVYDVAGRLCRTIFAGRVPAGGSAFSWDATGRDGRAVRSGLYLVVLRTGEARISRPVVRLR